MSSRFIKMEAIACHDLAYTMGEYICLRDKAATDLEYCMQCKFQKRRIREDAIRKGNLRV